jgi:hypothetical protein
MSRLYVALIYFLPILLFVAEPKESAGQTGRLASLQRIRLVVEEVGAHGEKSGVTRDYLVNRTLQLLRSKTPRLIVGQGTDSFLWINTRLALTNTGNGKTVYYGAVWVGAYRPVIIKKTGQSVTGMIWYRARSITGPLNGAISQVDDSLEKILTQFAAEWEKDNPFY